MIRLRREHSRMLGNGYCARPAQLDCAFESICETCTYFQPTIEFRPTLRRQHDDAEAKNQTARQQLFQRSSICSTASTKPKHPDQLDKYHPHNADDRTHRSLCPELPRRSPQVRPATTLGEPVH